jgi:hypothetical protein
LAGRPKGFAGVSKLILESTREGAELVEWALSVWRDTKAKMADRQAAHAWLSDRGLGKPLATHDFTVHNGDTIEPDFSHLSDDRIRELLAETSVATDGTRDGVIDEKPSTFGSMQIGPTVP